MNDIFLNGVAKAIYESIWDERWDALPANGAERAQYRQAAMAGLVAAQACVREVKAATKPNECASCPPADAIADERRCPECPWRSAQ